MKISTETNFKFTEKEVNKTYELDFGTIKKGTDTTAKVLFEYADHLTVKKSCGCTTPTIEILGNNIFNLIIQYDKNKNGTINQWVKETVLDSTTGKQTEVKVELKGTIV